MSWLPSWTAKRSSRIWRGAKPAYCWLLPAFSTWSPAEMRNAVSGCRSVMVSRLAAQRAASFAALPLAPICASPTNSAENSSPNVPVVNVDGADQPVAALPTRYAYAASSSSPVIVAWWYVAPSAAAPFRDDDVAAVRQSTSPPVSSTRAHWTSPAPGSVENHATLACVSSAPTFRATSRTSPCVGTSERTSR